MGMGGNGMPKVIPAYLYFGAFPTGLGTKTMECSGTIIAMKPMIMMVSWPMCVHLFMKV